MRDWKNSQALHKFCKAFDAAAHPSDKRFYRRTRMIDVNQVSDPTVDVEILNAVAIHIPENRLEDFLCEIGEQRYREMEIRDRVPAVKKAYEQYKLLLKMCGGDFDARY